MSVFGVILVRIIPAFSRIRTEYGEILISILNTFCNDKKLYWFHLFWQIINGKFVTDTSIMILAIKKRSQTLFYKIKIEHIYGLIV